MLFFCNAARQHIQTGIAAAICRPAVVWISAGTRTDEHQSSFHLFIRQIMQKCVAERGNKARFYIEYCELRATKQMVYFWLTK
jgi:hypothetical protein